MEAEPTVSPRPAVPSGADTVARLQDQLDHDDILPEEVRQVRAEVRAFATAEVLPRAYALAHVEESPAAFPRDLLARMAEDGLLRIPFSAADGGRGLTHPVAATAATIGEIAYHSASVAAIYDVQCILAGQVLAHGSQEIRARFLRPLLGGRIIASFATTEPLASSDLSPDAVTTVARSTPSGYLLHGHKRFITNAPVADIVVVLCRTDEALSELVVELDAPGVTVGAADRKLGNRAQLTADIVFDGVHVPADRVIGAPGEGLRVALAALTYGRIGIAASGVGMAQAAFDEAAAHLAARRAFGRALAGFQHWQFLMADRATEIECARNLYRKAAARRDQGTTFPEPEAAMAKLYATRLAADLARDAVQAFGGYGFMRELAADGSTYKVEALYRDAKIAEIYEGTNEIQRWIIARQIFGRELVG